MLNNKFYHFRSFVYYNKLRIANIKRIEEYINMFADQRLIYKSLRIQIYPHINLRNATEYVSRIVPGIIISSVINR